MQNITMCDLKSSSIHFPHGLWFPKERIFHYMWWIFVKTQSFFLCKQKERYKAWTWNLLSDNYTQILF
jgi:hypothetical protein